MAYFSNSSEGMMLDAECSECPLGEKGCPIYMVQASYNYEACNNVIARAILNHLVKQEADGHYIGCQMKPFIEQIGEKKDNTPIFWDKSND